LLKKLNNFLQFIATKVKLFSLLFFVVVGSWMEKVRCWVLGYISRIRSTAHRYILLDEGCPRNQSASPLYGCSEIKSGPGTFQGSLAMKIKR
jgi:hypothetical protein